MQNRRLASARVVWASLCFTHVMFGVVLLLAAPAPQEGPPVLIFPVMALLLAFGVAPVRWLLMGGLGMPSATVGQAAGPSDAQWLRYQSGTIVGLALAEAVSLMGFVHGFLTGAPTTYVPYALLGLVLSLAQVPTLGGAASIPERR